jgi:hypothetical protein
MSETADKPFSGRKFVCAYLKGEVELSEEREAHIELTHPDLLPKYLTQIGETLAAPDHVRRSQRMGSAHLFDRWFDDVLGGKYVVVVVVSEATPPERHWVITAYLSRKLMPGEIVWPNL